VAHHHLGAGQAGRQDPGRKGLGAEPAQGRGEGHAVEAVEAQGLELLGLLAGVLQAGRDALPQGGFGGRVKAERGDRQAQGPPL